MRFFDAHCDTIGAVWEGKADFVTEKIAGEGDAGGGAADTLHVTLPGLRTAGVRAQVFASWVWSTAYPGRESEVALGKVRAVHRLCAEHPDALFLATTGAQIAAACEAPDPEKLGSGPPTAVVASLEGTDSLAGEVANLDLFYREGVRLVTLAWADNAFCGSVFGGGGGLTAKGADLVGACEDRHVLVDVSHASDQAFTDICRVATRPFIASHSNCRALCPSPRNLTDEMIRAVADRGGVVGISLVPSFLSPDYYEQDRPISEAFWQAVTAGAESYEEAGRRSSAAEALLSRPPLKLVVDHVLRVIKVGGEDAAGIGGDLDGVDNLPAGLTGIDGYPQIAELLGDAGLTHEQIEKVCSRNMTRLFQEVLA